jgi:hypothetical protein
LTCKIRATGPILRIEPAKKSSLDWNRDKIIIKQLALDYNIEFGDEEYTLSQMLQRKNFSPRTELWVQIFIIAGFVVALFILILVLSMRKMKHIREGSVMGNDRG